MNKSNAWETHVNDAVDAACQFRKEAIDICLTEPFDAKVHSTKIEVGTRVAYSRKFLCSIGYAGTSKDGKMLKGCTNPIWHARGIVTKLKYLSSDVCLATVKWTDANGKDWPKKVNVANLATVGSNLAFCGD